MLTGTQDVVAAGSLRTTFSMIGGLGDLKNEIEDIVSAPLGPMSYALCVRIPARMFVS